MTDRQKVYRKVLKTLKEQLQMSQQGHVVTLAMMISGIVLSRKAQLAVISEEVPSAVKDQSIEMRMRRWVKHGDIDVEVTYMPFAQQILMSLADSPLVLAMGGSQVGRGCWVQAKTDWAFVLRTTSNLLIHDGAAWQPIGEVTVTHGWLRILPDIGFVLDYQCRHGQSRCVVLSAALSHRNLLLRPKKPRFSHSSEPFFRSGTRKSLVIGRLLGVCVDDQLRIIHPGLRPTYAH